MLFHAKGRLISTIVGIAFAFFLSAAQVGLLVGWCNTCTAIIRHADVDVWVMAEQTPAYDYGTPIPRQRLYQARSVPGVEWAEGMLMCWMFWQLPDGRQQNVEMVGVDEGLVGAPWSMQQGSLQVLYDPDSFIVDEVYCDKLGVREIGDTVEIQGRRAVVRGICGGVRTLTAAPFVFTSIENAVRYDPRYRLDEVTYVLVRGRAGESPELLRERIAASLPSVQVQTSVEFARSTIKYWMLETGLGITVILTAALGLAVSTVIISQTLYTITNEHLGEYATLIALGFHRYSLVAIVLSQAVLLGAAGVLLGSLGFAYASYASATTPIPIESTKPVFAMIVAVAIGCCLLASLLSIRTLHRIDPVTVFHR